MNHNHEERIVRVVRVVTAAARPLSLDDVIRGMERVTSSRRFSRVVPS